MEQDTDSLSRFTVGDGQLLKVLFWVLPLPWNGCGKVGKVIFRSKLLIYYEKIAPSRFSGNRFIWERLACPDEGKIQ